MTVAIQIASAVIALTAVGASVYFAVSSGRAAVTHGRIQLLLLRRKYDADLRAWADSVSRQMTEAIFLCDLDPARLAPDEFFQKRHQLRLALSDLCDRGRWFLPNIQDDSHGHDKPHAFRGFRQPSLDCVVNAYKVVKNLDCQSQAANLESRAQLVDIKRSFVSELQTILDPREKERETMKLLNSHS